MRAISVLCSSSPLLFIVPNDNVFINAAYAHSSRPPHPDEHDGGDERPGVSADLEEVSLLLGQGSFESNEPSPRSGDTSDDTHTRIVQAANGADHVLGTPAEQSSSTNTCAVCYEPLPSSAAGEDTLSCGQCRNGFCPHCVWVITGEAAGLAAASLEELMSGAPFQGRAKELRRRFASGARPVPQCPVCRSFWRDAAMWCKKACHLLDCGNSSQNATGSCVVGTMQRGGGGEEGEGCNDVGGRGMQRVAFPIGQRGHPCDGGCKNELRSHIIGTPTIYSHHIAALHCQRLASSADSTNRLRQRLLVRAKSAPRSVQRRIVSAIETALPSLRGFSRVGCWMSPSLNALLLGYNSGSASFHAAPPLPRDYHYNPCTCVCPLSFGGCGLGAICPGCLEGSSAARNQYSVITTSEQQDQLPDSADHVLGGAGGTTTITTIIAPVLARSSGTVPVPSAELPRNDLEQPQNSQSPSEGGARTTAASSRNPMLDQHGVAAGRGCLVHQEQPPPTTCESCFLWSCSTPGCARVLGRTICSCCPPTDVDPRVEIELTPVSALCCSPSYAALCCGFHCCGVERCRYVATRGPQQVLADHMVGHGPPRNHAVAGAQPVEDAGRTSSQASTTSRGGHDLHRRTPGPEDVMRRRRELFGEQQQEVQQQLALNSLEVAPVQSHMGDHAGDPPRRTPTPTQTRGDVLSAPLLSGEQTSRGTPSTSPRRFEEPCVDFRDSFRQRSCCCLFGVQVASCFTSCPNTFVAATLAPSGPEGKTMATPLGSFPLCSPLGGAVTAINCALTALLLGSMTAEQAAARGARGEGGAGATGAVAERPVGYTEPSRDETERPVVTTLLARRERWEGGGTAQRDIE